jgi:hypothetical protein
MDHELGSYAFFLVSAWWPSLVSYSSVITLGEDGCYWENLIGVTYHSLSHTTLFILGPSVVSYLFVMVVTCTKKSPCDLDLGAERAD